jgi:transposase
LSAITSEGLLMQKVIVGSAKAVDFAAFILDFPATSFTKVLLDNASIHKSKAVKEAFDRMGLSQVFTAPYSPEWNPVELYFSEIKRQYRQIFTGHINNLILLQDALRIIATALSRTYYQKIFEQVFRNIRNNHHR